MKVLFVDGPERGKVHDIKGHRIPVYLPPEVTPESPTSSDITMNMKMYNVHRFAMLNHVIYIASLQYLIDDIDLDSAFDLIASDSAKEASERTPITPIK